MIKKVSLTVVLLVFVVSLFFFSPVRAQMADPIQHQIKVHVDPETHAVYWPKDKKFWIRLATSADEDATSFLLREMGSKSEMTSDDYFNNGVSLDVSGAQFIRWYNSVSKDTVALKFYSDGDAPTSAVTLIEAPLFESDKKYYGKGLKCTLESSDNLSGVADIYYSIDGESFQVYQSTLILDQEKPYHLRYYAVDKVGYAAQPEVVEFSVDLTPPATKHETVENFIGDVLSPSTTFTLASTDAISGLDNIFYKFDDAAEFITYKGGNIALAELVDGEHHLRYYSIDKVANTEEVIDYPFYLDKVSPVSDIEVVGDKYSPLEGNDYVSPRSKVKLSSTDNKIGVDHIEYAINQGTFTTYGDPFPGPGNEGEFTVSYKAVDKLGNMSDVKNLGLRMDIKPPVSKFDFTGAHYAQSGVVWMTGDTRVVLSAEDDACGVLKTEYKIAEEANKQYSEPFNIQDEGRYLLKYWSYDQVNNREPDQSVMLIVDNTPPKIVETFSIVPTDTAETTDGKPMLVFPKFTSVFLATVDNSAGIDGIWYSVNGEAEKTFAETLFFETNGTYNLKVRSKDHVGNESSIEFAFMIRD
ncbi:hypothetical protein JW935_19725 [candidate division KSB1 bacterium]|nr:hypothetical protein [candidate division KSB1 bacterium]